MFRAKTGQNMVLTLSLSLHLGNLIIRETGEGDRQNIIVS